MRSGTVEHRYAKRARIVLLAADGVSNRAIGEMVGMHYNQVGGVASPLRRVRCRGLVDEERPGRPPVYEPR